MTSTTGITTMPNSLIPTTRQELVAARQAAELALVPATRKDLAHYAAAVSGSFKVPGAVPNLAAFIKAQTRELERRKYSAEVLEEAYHRALTTEPWIPDTARMVEICDELTEEKRVQLLRLEQDQHDQERSEAARQEVEQQYTELERDHAKRLGADYRQGDLRAAREAIFFVNASVSDWEAALRRETPWAFEIVSFMAAAWKRRAEWMDDQCECDEIWVKFLDAQREANRQHRLASK